MLSNNPRIMELLHESAVKTLSKLKNISLDESKDIISKMSFLQYHTLLEAGANIPSPSGGSSIGPSSNSVSPSANPQQNTQQGQQPGAQNKAQVLWQKGVPAQRGMTVGLQGQGGLPIPGEITQVDTSAKGVKVRNPTTGQEEWHGDDELNPYVSGHTTLQPNQQPQQGQQMQGMREELSRLKQLAGISEDGSSGGCTAGATSAGNVASSPAAFMKPKRRSEVDESPSLEHPEVNGKELAPGVKPNAASGRLSANLAAKNMKTASRSKNGLRR